MNIPMLICSLYPENVGVKVCVIHYAFCVPLVDSSRTYPKSGVASFCTLCATKSQLPDTFDNELPSIRIICMIAGVIVVIKDNRLSPVQYTSVNESNG